MKNKLNQETPFSRKQLWFMHNVVAHPAMELLGLFGSPGKELGYYLHDITCPQYRDNVE